MYTVNLSSPVVDIPIGAVSPTSLTQVRSQSDAGCFATGRAGVHIGGAMVFYLTYTHIHIYTYICRVFRHRPCRSSYWWCHGELCLIIFHRRLLGYTSQLLKSNNLEELLFQNLCRPCRSSYSHWWCHGVLSHRQELQELLLRCHSLALSACRTPSSSWYSSASH